MIAPGSRHNRRQRASAQRTVIATLAKPCTHLIVPNEDHRASEFRIIKESRGVEPPNASKAYNKSVGSFNSRLLQSATDTAALTGDSTRLPEELEAAETLGLTEVKGVDLHTNHGHP